MRPQQSDTPPQLKPLEWIASSRKDLKAMPEDVQDVFGYALQVAQEGGKTNNAKPLRGFGGASVCWKLQTIMMATLIVPSIR